MSELPEIAAQKALLLPILEEVQEYLTPELLDFARRELEKVAEQSVSRMVGIESLDKSIQAGVRAATVRGLESRILHLAIVLEGVWLDHAESSVWQWLKSKLLAILDGALKQALPRLQDLAVQVLVDALGRVLK